MYLTWLEMRDFRCHERVEFIPEAGVNVLIGPNGAGKTSILEAIGFASTLRSFRRTPDGALIRTTAPEAIIRLGVTNPAGERQIEISIPAGGRRKVLLNGKRPRGNHELAKTLPVVAFLPDDLDLVKGSPGRRRDFLDGLAAQLSPEAAAVQADYARGLRQRNTLLRQQGRSADTATLSVWDDRVAAAGGAVMQHRLELLDRLRPVLADSYESVSGSAALFPAYETRWTEQLDQRDSSRFAADLLRALEDRRIRDMDVRATTSGPHRDEPSFTLENRAVRTQASQGEQRSVALALRLASYHLLEELRGTPPVLLLDDVFSELDASRSEGVMQILPRGQVFVTSAREDEVPVAGRRWMVEAGRLS